MGRLAAATILLLASAFAGSAEAQCDGGVVAAWRVTDAQVRGIGIVEVRLHDVAGSLHIERSYKDGSGGTLLRVRRQGSALYYEQHIEVERVGGKPTSVVKEGPPNTTDFFKLRGTALEFWDDEGYWTTASHAAYCWNLE